MITNIRGTLARVLEEEVRIQVGALEYQVLVPDLVRRGLQTKLGEEVQLHTIEYLEGNPTRGRQIPRLVGFLSEPEIEFFELICTVDGIGVRTALKAMVRSVRDVADMIQRQDVQMLATLPGISSSLAERVIAKLRKKVTRFALMVAPAAGTLAPTPAEANIIEEAFLALITVGHHDADARKLIDKVTVSGKKFKSSQDILLAIYDTGH